MDVDVELRDSNACRINEDTHDKTRGHKQATIVCKSRFKAAKEGTLSNDGGAVRRDAQTDGIALTSRIIWRYAYTTRKR